MAGKVNTKFVVLLSLTMVLLLGAALGLTLWVRGRSADDLIKQGDAKMAEKNFEAAERAYSKAVNKDQANVTYLEKWLSSLQERVPETQTEYGLQFQKFQSVKRNIARLRATDVKAHREYLDLIYLPFTRERYNGPTGDFLISETERTLGLLRASKAEPGDVRRYRGLVRVRMMAEPGLTLAAEKIEEAKADLEAALAADPNDGASVIGLMNWHLTQALPLRRVGKDADAMPFEAAGKKVLSDYVAAHPDNAIAAANKLVGDLEETQKSMMSGDRPFREKFDATRAAFEKLKPRLEELDAVFAKVPAAGIDPLLLTQFRLCEQYIDPNAKESRTRAHLDRWLAAESDNDPLMIASAQVMGGRGEIDAAIAQLQRVVDLPRRPVSPAGIRLFSTKVEALYLQAGYLFQKWEGTKGEAERAALVDQAKKLRPVMALSMSEDAVPLLYIDAMSSFASGDAVGSRQLLAKFNEATGKSNVGTMWAQAQTELRLNNMGTARELLERVVTQRGDLPGPHVLLAKIEFQLKETEKAMKRLESVLQSDPSFQPALEALGQMKIATGVSEAPDKSTAVMVAANRLLSGENKELPDLAGAMTVLIEGIKANPDPRLFLALASLQAQVGEKPEAIETVKAGLKSAPDDADLKRALDGLSQADPVKWQLEQVDAAEGTDVEKLLQRSQILTNSGRMDEAAAALAGAAKAAPGDARVLDRQFLMALRQKDYELAKKIVAVATEKNLDGAKGMLYKSRALAAEGRNADAAVLLEDAVKAGTADAGSVRLLGRLYSLLGRAQDADRVFREALRQRPDDVSTMLDQINSLAQAGRGPEALERAREYERIGRGNRAFDEALVTLNAQYGDRDAALKRRELMLTREPNNIVNKLELAKLYAEGRRWNDATALIERVTSPESGQDVALLRARIRAEQGDVQGAQSVMDDFIKSLDPKELTFRPFMAFGQFLSGRQLYNEAVAMYERGRAYQTAGVMEVDRAAGDMLSTIGRSDMAIPYYEKIVEGKADGTSQEVRLRLVEMLLNLQKWDDAGKYMEGVTVGGQSDAVIQLLRADVAAGKGEDRKAREMYDRAITDFAQDPIVYFRRAQYFLRKTPPETTLALQDLDASIKVRPSFWQARRTRALVYVTLGQRDEALADLRETVKTNPALDDMRLSLMRELISIGRPSEAAEMADEALKVRPNDANLAIALSGVFLTAQDWPRGQQYAAVAWKLNSSPEIGQAYLDSLLNAEPKNAAAAETVLREKVISEAISQSSGLLAARAKVFAFKARMPDAIKDLVSSMSVVRLSPPTAVQAWWQDVRRVLTKPEDAIRFLERNEIPPRFRDWAAFLRASMYADNPQTRGASAKAFEEIVNNAKDEGILLYAYRAWGTVLYQENKHEEAAQVWTSGLGKVPDDSDLLNNLAYVTAKFLNKPAEALPIAERAVAASPNSSDSLDTLGYCYLVLGRLDEADTTLKKALAVARLESQRVAVTLHLCELSVARKDGAKGKVYLDALDELLKKNPGLSSTYEGEIEAVRKQIDSLGGR